MQSSWWYNGKTRSHRLFHRNPWRIRICLSGLIRSWRICHVTVLFRKPWLHHSSMNRDTRRRDRKPNLYQTRIRITHRFPKNIFGRPSGLKTNQLWNVARNISFQLSRFHSAVFGLFNLFILHIGRAMYFEKTDCMSEASNLNCIPYLHLHGELGQSSLTTWFHFCNSQIGRFLKCSRCIEDVPRS